MRRLFMTLTAGAALAATSVVSAEAMPVQRDIGLSGATVLVSGGCGPYGHRGPYGGCRPGGGFGPGWHRPGWGPGFHRGWRGPGWHRWHRW